MVEGSAIDSTESDITNDQVSAVDEDDLFEGSADKHLNVNLNFVTDMDNGSGDEEFFEIDYPANSPRSKRFY